VWQIAQFVTEFDGWMSSKGRQKMGRVQGRQRASHNYSAWQNQEQGVQVMLPVIVEGCPEGQQHSVIEFGGWPTSGRQHKLGRVQFQQRANRDYSV
jgi:hypothetical protein